MTWRYPDKFQDNLDAYLRYTGQKDEEGFKLTANTETSGRYHTNWLNMMLPRLKLARNLLRDDGMIFISIDDHEVANLRKICDELFGEENFLANIVWQKKTSPDARMEISPAHDHILSYLKSEELFTLNALPMDGKRRENYTNPDHDPRGPWASVDLTGQTGRAPKSQFYTITTPSGVSMQPPEGRCWALAERTFQDLFNDNRIWFGKEGSNRPRLKKFLSEAEGIRPWTWWDNKSVGHNQEGNQEVKKLFDDKVVFDNPKPIRLMQRIVQLSTKGSNDEIVLDFFAGSCSLAHATMRQNEDDNGKRRFIIVQLPEPVSRGTNDFKSGSVAAQLGYTTIADIGKERIRRAIKEIETERAKKVNGNIEKLPGMAEDIQDIDLGFKVFKLASSNIKPWGTDFDNLEESIFNAVENIKPDRSETDVLYELLLKFGLDLAVPIEERKIEGKTVYIIGAGALIVCLSRQISLQVVDSIAALRDELKPEVMRVVFKDSGFADDVIKTNAVQILRQAGIDDVKSL